MYFYSNTYYNHDRLKSNFMGRKKLYSTPEELREHIKAYSKAYYKANREKKIAIAKAFYLANKNKAKDRMKAYSKAYYEANYEAHRDKMKVYYEANRDKRIAYTKAYRKANRDKVNAQRNKNRNNRMKTDIQFKLSRVLRRRLYRALHGNYKNGSAVKDLGCTINEFKTHLESKFQSGMTWDNWSFEGWHIDHIKPLASFDLTDRQQLLMACHYTNLQPLWAKDNLIKSDKIIF
jgi:hypothetical protein